MKSKILPVLLFCFIFTRCIDEVDIVVKGKQEVVINCILQYEASQELQLVYAKALGGGVFYQPVEGAVIELWEDEGLIGMFSYMEMGRWYIDYMPKPQTRYKLIVKIPGRPEISATTTMPENPPFTYDGTRKHCILFSQQSQPYPTWTFCINSNGPRELWFNPLEKLKIESTDLMIDDIATNHPFADKFNATGFLLTELGDSAIHPGYFHYIRIKEHNVPIEFEIESRQTYFQFIVFRACSPEYDEYLKSSMIKVLTHESDDDIFYWFDEDQTYSNIKNGVGIFGAYDEQVIPIRPPNPFLNN